MSLTLKVKEDFYIPKKNHKIRKEWSDAGVKMENGFFGIRRNKIILVQKETPIATMKENLRRLHVSISMVLLLVQRVLFRKAQKMRKLRKKYYPSAKPKPNNKFCISNVSR